GRWTLEVSLGEWGIRSGTFWPDVSALRSGSGAAGRWISPPSSTPISDLGIDESRKGSGTSEVANSVAGRIGRLAASSLETGGISSSTSFGRDAASGRVGEGIGPTMLAGFDGPRSGAVVRKRAISAWRQVRTSSANEG